MNCIREAENYLRYYRELHRSVEHARYMKGRLMAQTAPSEVNAVWLEPTGIHSSRTINTLNQLYQIQKWQDILERNLADIERIDDILKAISQEPGSERYRDILIMWYVDKRGKEDIADELGYSSRQSIYDLRNRAIKKFAVALFGVVALEAI